MDAGMRTSMAGGAGSVDIGYRRGAVFAVIWAAANVIHLLNQTGGDLRPVSWVNLAAALWLLGRPGSADRLATLAASQLVDTVWLMPATPDHQILMAFVNVMLLASYLRLRRPADSESVVADSAPAARILLLVAYVAAATAKYNSDFFNPDTSCAGAIAEVSSFGAIDHLSTGAALFMIATIVSETAIPILLAIPWTRRWGVAFAMTFHYFVSLSPALGVADFTWTLWALFLLFVPPDDVELVGSRLGSGWRATRTARTFGEISRVFLAVLTIVLIAIAKPAVVHLGVWLFSTGAGLAVLVSVYRVLRPRSTGIQRIGAVRPLGLVMVALMVLWASAPYAGFGTSSRFTMFSGLRTEGPGTNHFFLPSYHLIDSQNDALVVVDSNGKSRALEMAAESQAAIPLHELQRYLQHERVGVTLETLEGQRIVVVAGEDHELRQKPPWWESKTQHYRPFKVAGVTDPEFCSN